MLMNVQEASLQTSDLLEKLYFGDSLILALSFSIELIRKANTISSSQAGRTHARRILRTWIQVAQAEVQQTGGPAPLTIS